MSKKHFEALQETIEHIESFGYREVTDEVKPYYQGEYHHLCTFERPVLERDLGPIYCTSVKDLWSLAQEIGNDYDVANGLL